MIEQEVSKSLAKVDFQKKKTHSTNNMDRSYQSLPQYSQLLPPNKRGGFDQFRGGVNLSLNNSSFFP